MHSAAWDGSYDLTNKTVAVIGGGSSAVQIVPNIQPSKSPVLEAISDANCCRGEKVDTVPAFTRMDHHWLWSEVCRTGGDELQMLVTSACVIDAHPPPDPKSRFKRANCGIPKRPRNSCQIQSRY